MADARLAFEKMEVHGLTNDCVTGSIHWGERCSRMTAAAPMKKVACGYFRRTFEVPTHHQRKACSVAATGAAPTIASAH